MLYLDMFSKGRGGGGEVEASRIGGEGGGGGGGVGGKGGGGGGGGEAWMQNLLSDPGWSFKGGRECT